MKAWPVPEAPEHRRSRASASGLERAGTRQEGPIARRTRPRPGQSSPLPRQGTTGSETAGVLTKNMFREHRSCCPRRPLLDCPIRRFPPIVRNDDPSTSTSTSTSTSAATASIVIKVVLFGFIAIRGVAGGERVVAVGDRGLPMMDTCSGSEPVWRRPNALRSRKRNSPSADSAVVAERCRRLCARVQTGQPRQLGRIGRGRSPLDHEDGAVVAPAKSPATSGRAAVSVESAARGPD
jgi:hypothetical protein